MDLDLGYAHVPDTFATHWLDNDRLGRCLAMVPMSWDDDQGMIFAVPGTGPPLVRIHSRCTYGDVFESRHCDCGAQLDAACKLIRSSPCGGMLIYLNQEGRAAGALVKAQAYAALDDRGIDTFEFFESIGQGADPRKYDEVVDALRSLALTRVDLLTNAPGKVRALHEAEIDVRRIPLIVESTEQAASYLSAKRRRGHLV